MTSSLFFVSDHICRYCLGRILVNADGTECRCSGCGHTEPSGNPKTICLCGQKVNGLRVGRCIKNEAKNFSNPFEIIGELIGGQAQNSEV